LLGALESGALAADFGGLVSLQIALAVFAPPLELPEALLEEPLPPDPHAARASVATAPSAAAAERVDLRIVAPFPSNGRQAGPPYEDDCLRREHIDTTSV
jgi:hypothetical protein